MFRLEVYRQRAELLQGELRVAAVNL